MQKDNTTLPLKISLRRNLLAEVSEPVVLETHGGHGAIYRRCYADLPAGIVMEKDPLKADHFARQRPTWAVYECDCVAALRAGVGRHLPVNFVDLDPYGEPWPVLDAFFQSVRPWPTILAIAVNDGLRQSLKLKGGWDTESMAPVVMKYGVSNIYANYLAICQELLSEKAGQRGYTLTRWAGYYCGHSEQMTHYGAIFTRSPLDAV
jgi:hypothetical protein